MVRRDVVKKTLVVSDDQAAESFSTHFIDPFRNNSQSIDVESRVDFIKYSKFRVKHHQLKNLITFFLSARESFVQITSCHILIHFKEVHFVVQFTDKFHKG